MTPEQYKQFLRKEYGLDGEDLDYAMEECQRFKGTIIRVWNHREERPHVKKEAR